MSRWTVIVCAVAIWCVSCPPAVARGGGHHHGECGEHYDCRHFEYEHHGRRGHHERHFEPYHRSGYDSVDPRGPQPMAPDQPPPRAPDQR